MSCADEQINLLERTVSERIKLRAEFCFLKTVPGIGQVLALTIILETGEIKRFPTVGDFASYCRCVGSQKLSNGKKKGQGNTKNGNKYLAWAFVEAANFAIRYCSRIKSFYQRKKAKSHGGIGAQSGGAQAVPSLLLQHETSGALRCDPGVCLREGFTVGMGQ